MKANYGYFGYALGLFVWIAMIVTIWVSNQGNLKYTIICGSVAVLLTLMFGVFAIKFVLSEVSD